jgi:hypothetical protein
MAALYGFRMQDRRDAKPPHAGLTAQEHYIPETKPNKNPFGW